jgi:transcriptional regulator with XRE-family HTH domain
MVNKIDAIIGTNLHTRRVARGMTQAELGRICNISPQQISKYELGEDQVCCERLVQFSNILKYPVTDFFDGVAKTAKQIEDQGTLRAMHHYSGLPREIQESLRELMKAIVLSTVEKLKPGMP